VVANPCNNEHLSPLAAFSVGPFPPRLLTAPNGQNRLLPRVFVFCPPVLFLDVFPPLREVNPPLLTPPPLCSLPFLFPPRTLPPENPVTFATGGSFGSRVHSLFYKSPSLLFLCPHCYYMFLSPPFQLRGVPLSVLSNKLTESPPSSPFFPLVDCSHLFNYSIVIKLIFEVADSLVGAIVLLGLLNLPFFSLFLLPPPDPRWHPSCRASQTRSLTFVFLRLFPSFATA